MSNRPPTSGRDVLDQAVELLGHLQGDNYDTVRAPEADVTLTGVSKRTATISIDTNRNGSWGDDGDYILTINGSSAQLSKNGSRKVFNDAALSKKLLDTVRRLVADGDFSAADGDVVYDEVMKLAATPKKSGRGRD